MDRVHADDRARLKKIDKYLDDQELRGMSEADRATFVVARRRAEMMETVKAKLHHLMWVCAAVFMVYYLDFANQIWHNPLVSQFWMRLAVTGLITCVFLTIYLIAIAPKDAGEFRSRAENYDEFAPRTVPALTISFLLTFLFFVLAIWPIYSFVAIPIVGLICTGVFFFLLLLP